MDTSYGYNNSTEYTLIGYNIHNGNAEQGHYYAYSYIESENIWYKYNDSKCTTKSPEFINIKNPPDLNNAYILMYQQKPKKI